MHTHYPNIDKEIIVKDCGFNFHYRLTTNTCRTDKKH